jgi:hypothetical protein
MSEREIRKFAKDCAGHYAPDGVRKLCRDLLKEEPDLVALLQELKDDVQYSVMLQRAYEEDGLTEEAESEEVAQVHLQGVIDKIEKTVHLTDDGWEWTEADE